MHPFTATLQLAGRAITVRELSMPDFRNLLFGDEIAASEAAAQTAAAAPVADVVSDPDAGSVTQMADNFINGWLDRHLGEQGVTLAFINVMSTATQADLLQARFSEIDALIVKIKTLNAPFFVLFQRLASATEPTSAAITEPPPTPPSMTPSPDLPPINASASSDPLLHSLGMAIQAHGTTATSSSSPRSTNSSTH